MTIIQSPNFIFYFNWCSYKQIYYHFKLVIIYGLKISFGTKVALEANGPESMYSPVTEGLGG